MRSRASLLGPKTSGGAKLRINDTGVGMRRRWKADVNRPRRGGWRRTELPEIRAELADLWVSRNKPGLRLKRDEVRGFTDLPRSVMTSASASGQAHLRTYSAQPR